MGSSRQDLWVIPRFDQIRVQIWHVGPWVLLGFFVCLFFCIGYLKYFKFTLFTCHWGIYDGFLGLPDVFSWAQSCLLLQSVCVWDGKEVRKSLESCVRGLKKKKKIPDKAGVMKWKADVQNSAVRSETFRFRFCHGCISPQSQKYRYIFWETEKHCGERLGEG